MNLQRIALLGALAVTAAACQDSAGPTINEPQNMAFVRYVHAVADTGLLEPRFIDQLEGSPYWGSVNYRGITNYLPASAGSRRLRIFVGSTAVAPDINVVSQVVHEETLNLEAGKYYTLLHTGNARNGVTPTDQLVLLVDNSLPTPGAQIAVRAVNASASTVPAMDVYLTTDTASAAPLPADPVFNALGSGTASAYSTRATGIFSFRATDDGSTAVLARATAPAGQQAATSAQSKQAGFSIAGSALTAFYFPRSVAGSGAPQTAAFTVPAIVWMQDNSPE